MWRTNCLSVFLGKMEPHCTTPKQDGNKMSLIKNEIIKAITLSKGFPYPPELA